ncbi:MAG: glycosyltransferase [Acidobacteria bacterium]|nr:glycosyltransferase [Acidobacteriota bacterium]
MRIAIFAKSPVPGQVKTRLGLDPMVAAGLHQAFVRDTVATALASGWRVELHTDSATGAWSDLDVPSGLQVGAGLGERMLAALPGLILGSDAPHLPVSHIRRLDEIPGDVVLGPAEDGGYWGILARRVHPAMFHGVEWSTSRTLDQTRAACHAAGLTTALGDVWFDIDEPGDLRRVAAAPPPHTAEFLRLYAAELHRMGYEFESR